MGLCGCRGKLIQWHPGFDLLVPASGPEINHEAVRTFVFPIRDAAAWAQRGVRRFDGGAGFLQIVHIEADVMDTLDCRRSLAEVRGILAIVLEDGKIDISITEPDAISTRIRRGATQFSETKHLLVKLCSLCRIVGR